jgi:AhpD family alkylhydroperoxidase
MFMQRNELDETMKDTTHTIGYEALQPSLYSHLGQTHEMMAQLGLDPALSTILELRASQINQCEYCVNMHLAHARKVGVSQDKLDQLVVWREAQVFSDAERAALAWTEAMTYLDRGCNFAPLREDLLSHFSDAEVSVITADIGMINLWNRVQKSKY